MRQIIRKKIIEGTSTPGIIYNLNYCYSNFDVYEDGTINCWELVDKKGLKNKIENGWVVTSVPNGQNLFIHGLGCYKIKNAQWLHSNKSYLVNIEKIIKKLNPTLENIFLMGNGYKKKNEERRTLESPQSIDIYVDGKFGFFFQEGNGFDIFIKTDTDIILSRVCVYKKEKIRIFAGDNKIFDGDYKQGKEFINSYGVTKIEREQKYHIPNLAIVINDVTVDWTDLDQKQKELDDIIRKINGKKTSLELCREAYLNYLIYTNDFHRQKLKEAYENVPEHERCYLGDMDYRDTDYRRIIYNPEEKRQV